jgi:hypothetical protein
LRTNGAQKRSEPSVVVRVLGHGRVFSCLFNGRRFESQKRHRIVSVFDRFLTAKDALEDGRDGDGLTIVRTALRRL